MKMTSMIISVVNCMMSYTWKLLRLFNYFKQSSISKSICCTYTMSQNIISVYFGLTRKVKHHLTICQGFRKLKIGGMKYLRQKNCHASIY